MFSRKLKTGYFILEGLNSFATVYYLYYLYFFLEKTFGFGNKANLAVAALNGAIYAVMSVWGGKFAQRFGYFLALKVGFFVMILALAVGSQLQSVPGQLTAMGVMIVGLCFTWPTLEALVSEGESRSGVQHMIGIYNVVWAGTGALAYFIGGALLETLGLRSLFYVPVAVLSSQLALTFWLEAQAGRQATAPPATAESIPDELHQPAPARARNFLRMAWLANPCAYIAINTLVAVIPSVAKRLELSTMLAGFCCSLWCFARLGAFVALWHWTAWHYRLRWLLLAYAALVATFAAILLIPNLVVLIVAQVIFGGAVGLIYYSSLFYSMDLSDTKGEHGGIHEAAIGLGNFAGPALGAASLHFLPQIPSSGAVAVTFLLLCGLGALAILGTAKGSR
jgi:predicted MFS family arabinose efflux permease